MDALHPAASPAYWTDLFERHDHRRAFRFGMDHLIAIAVLDPLDDRSLDDLMVMAWESGIDAMLRSVDLIILEGMHLGPIDHPELEVDLEAILCPEMVHSPSSFLAAVAKIRSSKNPAAKARMVLGGVL